MVAVVVVCCGICGCGPRPVGFVLTYRVAPNSSRSLDAKEMETLVLVINHRIGRSGRARVVEGGQVEVDVYGDVDAQMREVLKYLIGYVGALEFRITADVDQPADRAIIEAARSLPADEKNVMVNDKRVAEWVTYDDREFGPAAKPAEPGDLVTRMANGTAEALVLIDPMNVTNKYFTRVDKGLDSRGRVAVLFAFNRDGARRFQRLTSQNKPNPALPNAYRRLGIILDKKLLSAPNIMQTISDRGMISGGSMSDREVEHIIAILSAGSLPAPVELVDERRVTK
jgi:preprotein translocase subunit SecD